MDFLKIFQTSANPNILNVKQVMLIWGIMLINAMIKIEAAVLMYIDWIMQSENIIEKQFTRR